MVNDKAAPFQEPLLLSDTYGVGSLKTEDYPLSLKFALLSGKQKVSPKFRYNLRSETSDPGLRSEASDF
jgi:hypothetical protein